MDINGIPDLGKRKNVADYAKEVLEANGVEGEVIEAILMWTYIGPEGAQTTFSFVGTQSGVLGLMDVTQTIMRERIAQGHRPVRLPRDD
jgi:hypothetical protein